MLHYSIDLACAGRFYDVVFKTPRGFFVYQVISLPNQACVCFTFGVIVRFINVFVVYQEYVLCCIRGIF